MMVIESQSTKVIRGRPDEKSAKVGVESLAKEGELHLRNSGASWPTIAESRICYSNLKGRLEKVLLCQGNFFQ